MRKNIIPSNKTIHIGSFVKLEKKVGINKLYNRKDDCYPTTVFNRIFKFRAHKEKC